MAANAASLADPAQFSDRLAFGVAMAGVLVGLQSWQPFHRLDEVRAITAHLLVLRPGSGEEVIVRAIRN